MTDNEFDAPSSHETHGNLGVNGIGRARFENQENDANPTPLTPSRKRRRQTINVKNPTGAPSGDNSNGEANTNPTPKRQASRRRNGHPKRDTHRKSAIPTSSEIDGANSSPELPRVRPPHQDNLVARKETDTQAPGDDQIVPPIKIHWKRCKQWQKAAIRLNNQVFGQCYGNVGGEDVAKRKKAAGELIKRIESGDETVDKDLLLTCLPLLMQRDKLQEYIDKIKKDLEKEASKLSIAPWVDGVRGMGMLMLAELVGECSEGISVQNYKSVSALWCRMGLAVFDGERQRKRTGEAGKTESYSPSRRAVAWNLGESLMRAQREGDKYRALYDKIKARELAKSEGAPGKPMTKGWAHNRAKRLITKELLKDLYLAWNKLPIKVA